MLRGVTSFMATGHLWPSMSATTDLWASARTFISGMNSGFALVLAGHPFDTIKVRMQTEGIGGRFSGPMDCLRQTMNKEGMWAVYKGVTPPLLMTGFINSSLFGMQAYMVQAIKTDKDRPPTVQETMKAAVVSGFAISFVTQPMEAVKARLQVQYGTGATTYQGPLDCAKKVVAELGVRNGLYRGWTMSALCRMSNYAYFGPYELFRRQFGMSSGSSEGRTLLESLAASVLCGSLTGACYWSACYPFDVVKNRIMAAPDVTPPIYKNGLDCARQILSTQGARGFVVGIVPALLRSVPANASAFTAYELSMHLLRK